MGANQWVETNDAEEKSLQIIWIHSIGFIQKRIYSWREVGAVIYSYWLSTEGTDRSRDTST